MISAIATDTFRGNFLNPFFRRAAMISSHLVCISLLGHLSKWTKDSSAQEHPGHCETLVTCRLTWPTGRRSCITLVVNRCWSYSKSPPNLFYFGPEHTVVLCICPVASALDSVS